MHLTENLINRISIEASDLRIIPIHIPTETERDRIHDLVNEAISIQKNDSEGSIEDVQKRIDRVAAEIYGVDLEDIEDNNE